MPNIKSPRIISMVPSWTETLLRCGVPVSGRTRFCIEPASHVRSIPVVGGTKDWDWSKIQAINPDLIIFDKDENPKFMSEGHAFKYIATHVHDIDSNIAGIQLIADALSALLPAPHLEPLEKLIDRWQIVKKNLPMAALQNKDAFPGLIEWVQKPTGPITSIYYIIWKNPWMIATRPTFIGDMLNAVGLPIAPQNPTDSKYPELNLSDLNPSSTLLLFSSEPFPFHKKKKDLELLGFPSAIVDGQAFSWFGIHSLHFLEKHLPGKF